MTFNKKCGTFSGIIIESTLDETIGDTTDLRK